MNILSTQRRMGQKDPEQLVGKLHSIRLTVTGAVAHLYHIQRNLDQGLEWTGTDYRRHFVKRSQNDSP